MLKTSPKLTPYLVPLISLAFIGCSSSIEPDAAPSHVPIDLDKVPNAMLRVERINPVNQRTYTVLGKTYRPLKTSKGFVQRGIASWYGRKFHGRKTANGERYDMYAMTAAHKRLPLPTYVQIKNLQNGRSIIVRVNDRGPFHGDRIIDLSYTAAHKLGMLKKGTAYVEVRAIDPRNHTVHQAKPTARKIANLTSNTVNDDNNKAPIPPEISDSGIFIQAGAFSQAQNAYQLSLRLQKLQHPILIEAGKAAQGKVNRVLIGPLISHEVAQKVTHQLLDMAIYNAKLITR